jgi:hypothetical protein
MRKLYVFPLGLVTMMLLGADTIKLSSGPLIYPDKWFDTELLMLLEVDRENSADDYKLMFGPHPDGTGPMSAKVNQDGSGNWQVVIGANGFVYMTGIRPYGGTDGGSATSDGSIMIIERAGTPSAPIHRFYYLKRKVGSTQEMHVTNSSPTSDKKDIDTLYRYVEKSAITNDLLGPVLPIMSDQDRRVFVARVIEIAEANGLDLPQWPPP